MLELRGELLADIVLACKARQTGECVQRFDRQSRLVILILHRKQRTTFNPAMADARVLRQALSIIGGLHELVCAPHVVPFIARESYVSALHCIIIHRDDEQGSRIGGNIGVRIVLEPGHETRTLRNFMRNFAVCALKFADEIKCGARCGIVALCVESE